MDPLVGGAAWMAAFAAVAAAAIAIGIAVTVRRAGPLAIFRLAIGLLAGWALLATTALVWLIASGGPLAALQLAHRPGDLFSFGSLRLWAIGALGALVVFSIAFLLSQIVGRGLLIVLHPRPLDWPTGLARPSTPPRLLAYESSRPDALMFTMLVPSRALRWSREDVVLVSERLLSTLSAEEWAAVVAHELGHLAAYDGRYLTFVRTFAQLMRWDPVLAVLAGALTRREEFHADLEAVARTGRPRALARAIYKASRLGGGRAGPFAGLLGPGGARGQRQAVERIRRLVRLAESGRYPEEPSG